MWSALFPPICLGCERLLRHDEPLALCSRCAPEQARLPAPLHEPPHPGGRVRATWAYDGPLGRAVAALKFAGALALAGPLGRLLAEDPRLLVSAGGEPWDLVVAAPLHWRRRLMRGFDQSEALLHWALRHAARRGLTVPTVGRRVLIRARATQPQTSLDAHGRQANVSGAFSLNRRASVANRRILVVDDVTTTGATLRACQAALREAGALEAGGLALLRAE